MKNIISTYLQYILCVVTTVFVLLLFNFLAFVCRLSFEYGFSGELAFDSKTVLINHYKETLGAVLLFPPKRMAILSLQANKLVNSYYKDFRI